MLNCVRSIWVFFVVLCSSAFPALTLADTLKVGLSKQDYPPFHYEVDGALIGAAIEITDELALLTGHELEYHLLPFERVKRNLASGDLDMIALFFKTAEREKYAIYTDEPYIFESNHLVVSKSSASNMPDTFNGSLEPWKKYSFLSVRGYFNGDLYGEADFLNKLLLNDEEEVITRLLAAHRRPFVAINSKPSIKLHAYRMGVSDELHFIEPAVDRGGDYLAFSRKNSKSAQYAAEFSAAFQRFKKTPKYLLILEKYDFDLTGYQDTAD